MVAPHDAPKLLVQDGHCRAIGNGTGQTCDSGGDPYHSALRSVGAAAWLGGLLRELMAPWLLRPLTLNCLGMAVEGGLTTEGAAEVP